MGLTLGVNAITGEKIPFWFSKTDSKALLGQLMTYYSYMNYGEYKPEYSWFGLVALLKHFEIDLTLLLNLAERGEEEPIESFVAREPSEERIQLWHKLHAERIEREEKSWQDPILLIGAIKPLLKALDETPNIFSLLGITDQYFIDGYFRSDIEDLLKMLEWTHNMGIEKVQINMG